MNRSDIDEVYRFGFRAAHFDSLADDILIVEPLLPSTTTAAGIDTSAGVRHIPGTAALLYKVLACGDGTDASSCAPVICQGDVVVLRTAHLEPLSPELKVFAVHARHVLAQLGTLDDE